ncbi:acyl-CoA dehydrogenase family protein, partial [Streptomyces sp. ME02-7008A-1]|uniref:acyl-CoA dehydrogenase family protein n=1 Tax=Streptomyces sp. ME02-7008A-1 TaxID=3028647 RepID=UPI0029A67F72
AATPSVQVVAGKTRAMINAAESLLFGRADHIDRKGRDGQPFTAAEGSMSKLFASETAKKVTAQAVRRVLDDGLTVTTGGLTPPLRWRFEDLIASAEFPRLINPDVTFQVVRKGQLVAARRGFVNVEKTLVEADS